MDLPTNAERRADASRDLETFKGFSLPGVREKVSEVTALIGRGGIFSTYTRHDMSHMDAMLKMLDWIVPESTRQVMTPTDWLLVVLAIYLHDLGMVVPVGEFERRHQNANFEGWLSDLKKDPAGREYLGRTHRMTAEEKEVFLFQEFVRKGHADRVREWVTGRHSAGWGEEVRPLASAIAMLLGPLPSRFREHLGNVCASHHADNLENRGLFPLVARLGNSPEETANVQYAAILLRTADLLHVTGDRTPSIQYGLIRFSDPKSVEEWEKQRGTFAVGPVGRQLKEGDPDSAVIVVHADFTEELPLFALQEYISYADRQIMQSFRWAEKSREDPDGTGYCFPWHAVRGDVRLEGVQPLPLRFELDRGRLLDLLVGHTIYNEPTVAIRELLQNAIDAVRYQHYLDTHQGRPTAGPEPAMGKVAIQWSTRQRTLLVEDSGTGMDLDTIKYHLMNVGSSFYDSPQFETESPDFVPISRFGIGILTCFMVSDDVEIVTFKRDIGYRIRMTSVQSNYLLRELPENDPMLVGLLPHGTRVTLRLRDSIDLSKTSIEDIVRYWIILPECKVEYREQGKPPANIGFDSPPDALRHYYASRLLASQSFGSRSEVLLKTRREGTAPNVSIPGASYQLAFAVSSGYFPERQFETDRRENYFRTARWPDHPSGELPRVCIEGIRVSNSLPGFSNSEGVISLLSVRGSKKLRTTVSRSGLETDKEYVHVGRLCAEMLFEHIADEVKRISCKPGNPLSQASSACDWLFTLLENSVVSPEVEEHLAPLYDSLDSIVKEEIGSDGGERDPLRRMLSPASVRTLPEFWTVESRLVDSLGTISRDLGKELSVNQFLVTLAPDVKRLKYSPLLPDAQLFTDIFWVSHVPEHVDFSRAQQQSAIRWVRRSNSSTEIGYDLRDRVPKEALQVMHQVFNETYPDHYDRRHSFASIILVDGLFTAPLVGDYDKVKVVRTRTGTVLGASSDLLESWRSIRSGVLELAGNLGDLKALITLLWFARDFATVLSRRVSPGRIEDWRPGAASAREVLGALGKNVPLPEDYMSLVQNDSVFDAVSYWRDWQRRPEGEWQGPSI